MQKPSIPKGTRDFSPTEMVRRNYIFDTIRSVFQLYGYLPLETPAMENLSTLTGKYGEEGDKLLFKILNSGDFLSKADTNLLVDKNSGKVTSQISEKGLKYDLTVPFARYVVQHQNEITFPFKRYQIQPVWRADRPQKGRYREFYQCDVDVIGSKSLLNEVELVLIIAEVFKRLNINTTIRINNRKILYGIAEVTNSLDKFIDITVAIDKLDKIGIDGVVKELVNRGISTEAIDTIKSILDKKNATVQKTIYRIKPIIEKSETGIKGIEEVQTILSKLKACCNKELFTLDLTLARGLNYYTGTIFEVVANDVQMGSICGGGRFDDLTGIFGLKDVSGVGISFGADRIYDVLNELNLFPTNNESTTQLLLINFGKEESEYCLRLLNKFRLAGINTELYPDEAKMKKQMNYANKLSIPYVLMVGEEEIRNEVYSLKNMETGEQKKVELSDAIRIING